MPDLPQPIGVLAAMEVEGDAIEAALDQPITTTVFGCRVIDGMLAGRHVLLGFSGVGKVNATLATAALAQSGASCLVLIGMAGTTDPGVSIGDAVIATDLIQHDVDVSMFGHPLGYIAGATAGGIADKALSDSLALAAVDLGATVHRGRIASGDQFIASPERSRAIAEQFDAIAVEMEGAAVAQACTRMHLPFAVLRWISDAADDQAMVDFPVFVEQIAQLDLAVIRRMLVM